MENFKFTRGQLNAISLCLDFSTPSALLASVDILNENIGRGDDDSPLPECLQRDAFDKFYSVQWEFQRGTEVSTDFLTSKSIARVAAYIETAQQDPEQKTGWEFDRLVACQLRVFGTDRLWLIEQLNSQVSDWAAWDAQAEQLSKNTNSIRIIAKHADQLLSHVMRVQELCTKAMRERMTWTKSTAMAAENLASALLTKMATGHELNQDDMRELKRVVDNVCDVSTHGLSYDRKGAINRLVNDEVRKFQGTAKHWLKEVSVEDRQEDIIVAQLVELQTQGEDVKAYHVDNSLVMTAHETMLGKLRRVTRVMTSAGWSRESLHEDIANAKQAINDLIQVRDLFIDRLSEEANEQLAKVSLEDIISQLDALAGVVAVSTQETAEA